MHHKIKFSAYTVSNSFSSFRLSLVSVIFSLLTKRNSLFSSLTEQVWKCFITWMLEYRNNDMYQNRFRNLLIHVIHMFLFGDDQYSNMSPTECIQLGSTILKHLLVKQKLLTKLLQCYDTLPRTVMHGIILDLSNHLRLAVDLLPKSNYFSQYLISHDLWRGFLPELTNQICIQTSGGIKVKPEIMNLKADDPTKDGDISVTSACIIIQIIYVFI